MQDWYNETADGTVLWRPCRKIIRRLAYGIGEADCLIELIGHALETDCYCGGIVLAEGEIRERVILR